MARTHHTITPRTSIEVLERLDLDLLDKQIKTLSRLCDSTHIHPVYRKHVEGVCDFLVDLYNAMRTEQQ